MKRKLIGMIALCLILVIGTLVTTESHARADTEPTIDIPATSDIFAADLASVPAFDGGGGTLPPSVAVAPGAVITVSASGSIDCGGGAPSGPDGSTGGGTVSIQSYGGISGADIPGGPICGLALAGVFTGTTPPADPAPVRLNFASGAGTSFTSLSPALNQTFFIGDGLTGTGTGTTQTFVVPQGATTLWLGYQDGQSYTSPPGYYGDDTGSVSVIFTVLSTSYQYVAMGDSYSSGEGAADSNFEPGTAFPDPTTGGTTGCHRSTTAWANAIASAEGLSSGQWYFAACSGAAVSDFYVQNTSYPNEPEQPQMSWLSPTATRLVTFTIGGNDVGFDPVLRDCVYDAYGQYGSPGCRNPGRVGHDTAEAGLKTLQNGIRTGNGDTTTTLANMYLTIASHVAPGAKIVVAGYPRLFGEKGTNYPYVERGAQSCYMGTAVKKVGVKIPDDLYISLKDAEYIDNVTDRGDQIIADQIAAANAILAQEGSATRVIMASTLDTQFHQHRLCDNSSAYFNALIFHGTHLSPDQRSFHPNASGQRAYAKAIRAALGL